jgi:hypothetical protein
MAGAKTGDTGAELTSVGVLKLAKMQQRRQKQKRYGSKRYKAMPLGPGGFGRVWPFLLALRNNSRLALLALGPQACQNPGRVLILFSTRRWPWTRMFWFTR